MDLLTGRKAPYTVLTIALLAYLIPLAWMVGEVLEHNHGIFSYPLDDSYIHLAVAKNLALNNIWGISGHEFASASSSVLYPLLLSAIFKITGVHTIVPFIVNLITGIVFIVVVQRWLSRQIISPGAQLIVLLLTIFLIPLPGIVLVSMEHTLHLLFFFLFLVGFSDALENITQTNKRALPWKLYLYGALMVTARFESIALLLMACALLLFVRRWVMAIQLGVVCFLPILAFGIWSLVNGGFFLPNSVLLKSATSSLNAEDLISSIKDVYLPRFTSAHETFNTLGVQRLLLVLPLAFLIFYKQLKEKPAYRYILLMLIACTVFHIAFMTFSFYARYEAYLVGSSVVVVSLLAVKFGKSLFSEQNSAREWVTALLGLCLLAPLITRSWNVFDQVSLGAKWTYDQQYHMGQFVHNYYDQDGVAFNDIGAVSYFSEGRKLDILGLGNNDIARMRRMHANSPEYLNKLCNQRATKIAIVYEPRFRKVAQPWTKVASWDIPWNNPINFYDSVSFYAIVPQDAPALRENLQKYQPQLPKEVIVKYY